MPCLKTIKSSIQPSPRALLRSNQLAPHPPRERTLRSNQLAPHLPRERALRSNQLAPRGEVGTAPADGVSSFCRPWRRRRYLRDVQKYRKGSCAMTALWSSAAAALPVFLSRYVPLRLRQSASVSAERRIPVRRGVLSPTPSPRRSFCQRQAHMEAVPPVFAARPDLPVLLFHRLCCNR